MRIRHSASLRQVWKLHTACMFPSRTTGAEGWAALHSAWSNRKMVVIIAHPLLHSAGFLINARAFITAFTVMQVAVTKTLTFHYNSHRCSTVWRTIRMSCLALGIIIHLTVNIAHYYQQSQAAYDRNWECYMPCRVNEYKLNNLPEYRYIMTTSELWSRN